MPVYIISYDLNKSGQDYNSLYKAIDQCSIGEPWHGLDSTWLIKSSMTASEISNHIRKVTDRNDNHLVIEITKHRQGWLPESDWPKIQSLFF